ncbi:MAG: 4'-phosphopantetheinyl transferase superfamily protein [Lachnospiraceae bacterium]|nr:4'-phosphopantetheinyl transferase superfamily protein [Lachnospiraceae bacterium]
MGSKYPAYVLYEHIEKAHEKSHEEISRRGTDLLARGLSKYYGVELEEDGIAKGRYGKPYLVHHPEIHFNISNSGEYVIVIIAGLPVGIDLQEKKILDMAKLGKKIFSIDEYREFLASSDQQDEFFRKWVLKESYVKWTGEGLLHEIKNLPGTGWHQFLLIDKRYACAVHAEVPLALQVEEAVIYE